MSCVTRVLGVLAGCLLVISAGVATGQDWPQWRGPNRDAKATGFNAPANWPAELTNKWDVPVGNGVSNPSLVGDRLYAFAREGDEEVIRCLNATTGDVIWKKSYPSEPATGPAGQFPGPRATPAVADGKVVTLGVRGIVSCFDTADGNELWRKDDFAGSWPNFFTSSSPIIVDGMAVVQLGGGRGGGAMVAYDLTTGDEKWRVDQGSAAYGSPVLMTVEGLKVIVAPTGSRMVAVTTDGNLAWELPYDQGRYNSSTPIVNGQTLIIAGPGSGMTGVALSRQGNDLTEEELWRYEGNDLIYNTPVLKDGVLYGLSTGNELFCINQEHATGWATPIASQAVGLLPADAQTVFAQRRGRQRSGGGRRGGGMGGRPGFGSVVDVGPALLAIGPAAELVVFRPSDQAFAEVARYKVSEDGGTYSYPIPSGNRIFIKDADSVSLWTLE